MTQFIEKLNLEVDLLQVQNDLESILGQTTWEPENQIGIRHRPAATDQWKDGTKWTYDTVNKKKLADEIDFSCWNSNCPQYTRSLLEQLSVLESTTWGRIRFMKLLPKQGLTMHKDNGFRYHLVLETNPNAIFAECFTDKDYRSIGYHIPADAYWYKIDTSREHFVYNGGWKPRIHLVACAIL